MNKELQELKIQLDEWISKTDPNIYEHNEKEYHTTVSSLSTLLIVRDWVTNKLTQKFTKQFKTK
jgi:hypothetical protein